MTTEIVLVHSNELPLIAEHQPVEFAYPVAPNARLALSVDGIQLEPFLRPGEATWRWRWNPGSAVGLHQVALAGIGSGDLAARLTWPRGGLKRKVDKVS